MHILRKVAAILTGVAALIGGASIAAGANAAPATFTSDQLGKAQPITVDASSSSLADPLSGSTFKAVPLAYYSSATYDGSNILSYDLKDAGLASSIKNALDHAGITPAPTEDATNPMVWVAQNLYQPDSTASPWSGKLRDFLDKLQDDETFKTYPNSTTLTVSGKKATADVTPGIYAIVDTTPGGTDHNQRAAIIALDGTGINDLTSFKPGSAAAITLGTVEYKSNEANGSATTVTKKIIGVSDHNHGDFTDTYATTAIGKQITYELDSTVPNWTGYDKYYYGFDDSPANALTIDPSTVTVTVNRVALSAAEIHATVSSSGKLTIKLGDATGNIIPNKTDFPVGKAVVVTYKATLNNKAVSGTAEKNGATVTYSINPNDWTARKTSDAAASAAAASVYTGKFSVHKTDVQGNKLAGAKFQIYETDGTNKIGNPLKIVKTSNATDPTNKYRLATSDDTNTVSDSKMVTDADGNFTVDGVDGTYELVETDAPSGFAAPALTDATFFVSVSSTGVSTTNSIQDSNRLAEQASSDPDTIHAINARNITEMPKTGAAGILMNVIIALLLVAAGVTALLIHRHNKKVASAK